MGSEHTEARPGILPAAFLTGLIVIAIALRFYRLGDWNFESTEIFTLRDSLRPRFTNPRPLIYLLNYYLVRPLFPLNEFGLRLLPAAFGVLAIPAFYLINRRLLGARAALLGSLLLTFSALHVFYSQFARYWSLVFLLCAIYPYAIYLGIRDRDGRMLGLGILTGVLAALAHPVSVLLVGGPALWLGATYLRPGALRRLWNQKASRWGIALGAIVAGAIMVRMVPIFRSWVTQHDTAPGTGQFLLRIPVGQGMKQVFYLVAYVESLTIPVVLAGAVGVYILWRERDRTLALLLVSLSVFPILFLTFISLRTPVSQYYLLPPTPVFFMGAGVFLDRLFQTDWRLSPRWLVPVTVTIITICAGAPTLVSQYRDGRRYNFRSVAHWLEPRVRQQDVIFSDQALVLGHYLPNLPVRRLREPAPLVEAARDLGELGRGGTLWIVVPARSHALRSSPSLGSLNRWMYDNCQLRNTIGVGRVDFRQQYLQIYRCPPGADREPAVSSE